MWFVNEGFERSGRFAVHGELKTLLAPIDYQAVGQVVRGQRHGYSVTEENLDSVAGHPPRKLGEYAPAVLRFDLIHSAGMDLNDCSFDFYVVISGHLLRLSGIVATQTPW